MTTIRLTAARAAVRCLAAQDNDADASLKADWFAALDPPTDAPADSSALPSDSQVIGAVQRSAGPDTVVMSAADAMGIEMARTERKVIGTDPYPSTPDAGYWWDAAVPEGPEPGADARQPECISSGRETDEIT